MVNRVYGFVLGGLCFPEKPMLLLLEWHFNIIFNRYIAFLSISAVTRHQGTA